jgi:hypothetical protein
MKVPVWLSKNKSVFLIVIVIFAVYFATSFDVCNYPSQPQPSDKGFIFDSAWTEHLHTSECYAVYYQTGAFASGRTWITQDMPPDLSRDVASVDGKYYAIAEPVTSAMLVPFYAVGNALFGFGFTIRSVMIGMMLFTAVSAVLVWKISRMLDQSDLMGTIAAFIFAFATMAFSYSKLLYPQPVSAMLMLASIVFLLSYKSSRKLVSLGFFAFFYALTVFSFNAYIITVPFLLYYLYRIGVSATKKSLDSIVLGVLPILILFFAWNTTTTGNPLTTPRQIIHQSMSFDLFYTTANGTWLNVQGIVGSLFSPVGIFFISPILLAAFVAFKEFKKEFSDEAFLFAGVAIVFWLFMSWANLGGSIQRDFWVGGWASIARYMYIPSTLLVLLAVVVIRKVKASRNLAGVWLISIAIIISILANLSYSIRHDLMVGYIKDVQSTSLLIWPSQIGATQLAVLVSIIMLVSFTYPVYLFFNKSDLVTKCECAAYP